MASRFTSRGLLLAISAVVAVSGCGSKGPRLAQVSGSVTHRGTPVTRLEINFSPESGRPSVGRTDADGQYALAYDKDRKGAIVGKHKVWVRFLPKSPVDEPGGELNTILEKYGSAKSSPLSVEVLDEAQVIDLPLD